MPHLEESARIPTVDGPSLVSLEPPAPVGNGCGRAPLGLAALRKGGTPTRERGTSEDQDEIRSYKYPVVASLSLGAKHETRATHLEPVYVQRPCETTSDLPVKPTDAVEPQPRRR